MRGTRKTQLVLEGEGGGGTIARGISESPKTEGNNNLSRPSRTPLGSELVRLCNWRVCDTICFMRARVTMRDCAPLLPPKKFLSN